MDKCNKKYCNNLKLKGLSYCEVCSKRSKIYGKTRREKQKKAGLCIQCSKPAKGKKLCLKCSKKAYQHEKRQKDYRKLNKLCTNCGKKNNSINILCIECSYYQNVCTKKYRNKNKKIIFNNYGNKCNCCGETNIKLLTLDHINGGGNKHIKEINMKLSVWIIKNNFPSIIQLLCYNCNMGRNINGGICPHKMKEEIKQQFLDAVNKKELKVIDKQDCEYEM